MPLIALDTALTTLRSFPVSVLSRNIQPGQVASSSRSASYVSLDNLSPAPGSHRPTTRVGRGIGSGKGGHTTGRGHKGAKARGTGLPYVGFEGGQTPLHQKLPKRGFLNFTAKTFAPLPISRVQSWIAQNRLDPSKPVDIRAVVHTNLVHGLSKLHGVKLLGDINPQLPLPALTVHLSRFSKTAAKAILDAGGSVMAVYHNQLGLRQEIQPGKFKGRNIQQARPTGRADILYYTDPKNHGYLADQKEEFFRERGFDPASAVHRPASLKAAGRA